MSEMSTEVAADLFGVSVATISASELHQRYRELLKTHHPDLGDDDEREMRDELTRTINAAYRWLCVVIQRRDDEAYQRSILEGTGWEFSPSQPDWWPSEPPPSRNPRKERSPRRRKQQGLALARQTITAPAVGWALILVAASSGLLVGGAGRAFDFAVWASVLHFALRPHRGAPLSQALGGLLRLLESLVMKRRG
jgi:hypothetical protein